jgi:hypothetical protein
LHSVLKGYIKISSRSIPQIINMIDKLLLFQYLNYRTEIFTCISKKPTSFISTTLFKLINNHLSKFCLRETQKKYSQATSTILKECSHVYTRTMGIPCSHKIKEIIMQNKSLTLDDFHPFWDLRRVVNIIRDYSFPGRGSNFFLQNKDKINEEIIPYNFRKKEKKGKTNHGKSTKRDLSFYEKKRRKK